MSSKTLRRSSPCPDCGKNTAKKRAPDTVKNWATLQPEAQCWTRRYEQLREQGLAKDTLIGTDFRGLSLLIRQGVVASEILTSFRINLSLFGEKSGGDLWSGKGSLTLSKTGTDVRRHGLARGCPGGGSRP